jgi:5-methyltetrahydropteroyltriglutamate--homocysteine methyltransferase
MDRIPTTHAGSLIRPPELFPFLAAMERGEPVDEQAHAKALKDAVEDVVRRQVAAGIDVVSDGELGKPTFITYLYGRVGGLEQRVVTDAENAPLPTSRDRLAFPDFYAEHDADFARNAVEKMHVGAMDEAGESAMPGQRVWFCTGPLTYDSSALERDIANLRAALEGTGATEAFIPTIAPASTFYLANEHYASDEEFVYALADAMHEEYTHVVDAGFLLQVDDPVLLHEYDTMLARGSSVEDYRKWAELRVDALNHALEGIPEDRVRYHVCYGSWHGPHVYDPPLREIIDLVLRVNAGFYSIEQANARHEHEWRLWEDVKLADGKVLIPGVVTHHTNVVEHPELVAERLVRLANVVGRDNVIGGTDCGFAQGWFFQRVHPSIQWAKLEALAEGAKLASRELWGAKAAV